MDTINWNLGSLSFKKLNVSFKKAVSEPASPVSPGKAHQQREWPTSPDGYEMLEECGHGAHAVVFRALCGACREEVAIKRLDLLSSYDLAPLIKEVALMKSFAHPNVLPLYASFVSGEELWMVMPFASAGSVRTILKRDYPEGLEEPVIATIMRDVLKGLEYVHKSGGIHRDIKADNILVEGDGTVVLADFGVAAATKGGSVVNFQRIMHSTFVGTPCWMAPEVVDQAGDGYDVSADIWSVGITIYELAYGRVPLAKQSPMRVMLSLLQNPPPRLEQGDSSHAFSKAMHEVVALCLDKDPTKRPSATQLLSHKFFRQARDKEFLVTHLLSGLSPRSKAAALASPNNVAARAKQALGGRRLSVWDFSTETERIRSVSSEGSRSASEGGSAQSSTDFRLFAARPKLLPTWRES